MNLLPFDTLPTCAPRRYVPDGIDLGDWPQIAPLFDYLDLRAGQVRTVSEFEQWILDGGELSAVLDEEGSKRYIAMTCHTDNAEAEKAYLHFVEKIEPQLKPRHFKLAELYLAHPLRDKLPKDRYAVFDRNTRVQVELFRPENVPLETEEAKLCQHYQKLSGVAHGPVSRRGKDAGADGAGISRNPTARFARKPGNSCANRRLREADKFEEIFEQLLKLREQDRGQRRVLPITAITLSGPVAASIIRRKIACDFTTPSRRKIMPPLRAIAGGTPAEAEARAASAPWDLSVDPLNRPPLRPFEQVGDMVAKTQAIFDRLEPGLARGFQDHARICGLLDLDNRKGKAPGGYQSTLAESRLPFIFMNAVGVQRDVETILHEAGHAFHALATRDGGSLRLPVGAD